MATSLRPTGVDDSRAPSAGVIREARARRARRRRYAVAGSLIAGLVAVGAWFLEPPPRTEHPPRPGSGGTVPARSGIAARSKVYLSPFLTGGGYGWCVVLRHGGGCPTMLTDPVTTVGSADPEQPGEASMLFVLAPGVADVLVDGRRGRIAALGRLPYGLRLVRIAFPRGSRVVFHAQSLRPIDGAGRPLASAEPVRNSPESPVQARWWQAPESPPPGPCGISQQDMPGLKPEWGHVASEISPFPAPIIGRAFFTCLDAEYTLGGWPLKVALLLDARDPRGPVFPIPDMRSVPGSQGIYEAPAGWNRVLTIARAGKAWLVVSGGSGLRQRTEVLRHLHAYVT